MNKNNVLSPSQVGNYIKYLMERDDVLSGIMVGGEISNYKAYPSGHHYFSLKDSGGVVRCVMFRSDASHLKFTPKNGMQVIAAGRISVFPRDGQYQLYCSRLLQDGAGDLNLAFEQLKEKLENQGLFDLSHKKPLPQFPNTIALITSPAGAAVQDMIRILNTRYPVATVVVLPVRVQGQGAADEISAAIRWANQNHVADVIITGRGGGSIEDLWAFNEEIVARAIFESEIPVISAVGHEPDRTIADYVADARASTPSNGAEIAVMDRAELHATLLSFEKRMHQVLNRKIENYAQQVNRISKHRLLQNPQQYLQEKRHLLDRNTEKLSLFTSHTISAQKSRLSRIAASLDALSPLKVLARGYSIAKCEDGAILKSKKQVAEKDQISLSLSDGEIYCTVDKT